MADDTEYTVKDGDDLTHIAEEHGLSVDELAAQNPDIENVDLIYPEQKIRLRERKEIQEAAKQDQSEGSISSPISLQEPGEPPTDSAVAEEPAHGCKPAKFVDVIHITGTSTFYLLPEQASNDLHEAANALTQAAAQSGTARIQALESEAGIISYLLPASEGSFLSESERKQYNQLTYEINDFNSDIDELDRRIESASMEDLPLLAQQKGAIRTKIRRHERTLRNLRKTARTLATENGYTIDGNAFYGPWVDEIKAALEAYKQSRSTLVKFCLEGPAKTYLDTLSRTSGQDFGDLESINGIISAYQELSAACENDKAKSVCVAPMGRINTIRKILDAVQKRYADSIIKLGDLGIAVPELALAGDEGSGTSEFGEFNKTLLELHAISEQLKAKVKDWSIATGRAAPIPMFVFKKEREKYRATKDTLDRQFNAAKARVKNTVPRRTLFWHTDIEDSRYALGYKPTPISLLVKKGYPLREFTSPKLSRPLAHVSLKQLPMTDDEADAIAAALDQDGILPANPRSFDESALGLWLRNRGALAVSIRDEWFNELGFFEASTFIADIKKSHDISCLDGQEGAWGDALERMLFEAQEDNLYRFFDVSAQAQYSRLFGVIDSELNQRIDDRVTALVELPGRNPQTAPSFEFATFEGSVGDASSPAGVERKARNGLQSDTFDPGTVDDDGNRRREWQTAQSSTTEASAKQSFEIKGAFNLAKGEIELGSLELPTRAQARQNPIKVELDNTAHGVIQRDLGAYTLEWNLVAKGLAAVSVQLSESVGISVDPTSGGASLQGIEFAGGASLEGQLYAGVSLALESTHSLNWCPPSDAYEHLPAYAAHKRLTGETQAELDWTSLARATFSGEAGAGAGGSIDFALKLEHGRLIFESKLKAFCGAGVAGKVSVALDLERLDFWMLLINQAMIDNRNKVPAWIHEDAGTFLENIGFAAAAFGIELALLIGHNVQALQDMIDTLRRGDRSGMIAYKIVTDDAHQDEFKHWMIRFMPGALGPLLNLLTSEPASFDPGDGYAHSKDEALVYQQKAMYLCANWLYEAARYGDFDNVCYGFNDFSNPNPAQTLYTEAMFRMNVQGDKARSGYLMDFYDSRDKIKDFMNNNLDRSGYDNLPREAQSVADSYHYLKFYKLFERLAPLESSEMDQYGYGRG
ncbi:LysM peptidoglycan-binding domain-containing protein [Larsenimonas suaedae]|uniref:LysM domain-containing protein n=1 Tax=Larsenimonas suaedae TaxID=1851019 RepID=A0ABU1GWA9_9GAMM|nr:LysM domain-containing protein [Larsenimonas suaedae]MCM2973217.1 LysM peptidoglycan-binding domain-containing protein [Larsenimonas suaedae]MDR5896110.1 LysM domain-containing protein [Larsenimonas suaedae]